MNMNMYHYTLCLLVLLALATPSLLAVQNVSAGQSIISGISINIYYDIIDNYGIVVTHLTLNTQGGNITEITLPLINASEVTVLNVTDGENSLLLYSYDSKANTITIYANNTDTVTIYYTLGGLFSEAAPATYTGLLDLSSYEGVQFSAKIILEGTYNVTVEPSATVTTSNNETVIDINEPDLYSIIVTTSIPATPATSTPTQTTHTTATVPPFTSTTSSSGPTTSHATTSPTTTIPTGSSSATSGSSPSTGGGQAINWLIITIVIIIVIIVIVAAVWLLKK
jgi:hypothetical protein